MIGRLPGATSKKRICAVLGASRATLYRSRCERTPERRGPKPQVSDDELARRIEAFLREREEVFGFRGEGHRKAHAWLRIQGVPCARRRVLRVMREHGLLAPCRSGRRRGPYVHDGVLVTDKPDQMWGTDATSGYTRLEGWAWIFAAIDHCTGECVGIHAARPGTRYEALEPIHQGVREYIGDVGEGVAAGLTLRHDHGSQYISHAFQDELRFLGIESSPSFVGAPEGNGIAERFMRTLKEQLLWVKVFDTVEELRRELLAFRERYNENWMLGRHGYASPAEARRKLAGTEWAVAA